MNVIARTIPVAMLALACAGCSGSHESAPAAPLPAPAASALPGAGGIPLAPATAGSAAVAATRARRTQGPTLAALLQRPDFAQAFEAMDGAAKLPAWTRQGGVSTPSRQVQVGGHDMWLVHACQASECGSGELWLLVDPGTRGLQGLFIEQSGQSGASVQQMVWLGKPGADARSFLQERVAED